MGAPWPVVWVLSSALWRIPLSAKKEGRIVYVDYTDTGTLRQIAARSPNLIESAVVEVDIDLRRGSLVDLCLAYEHIVTSQGLALADIASSASDLGETLVSENTNSIYDWSMAPELAERLLARNGAFWHHFMRSDLLDLLRRGMSMQPTED